MVIRDYFAPIAEIRIVKRVTTDSSSGINVVTVTSERLEFRRQNEASWQRCDVIVEREDDKSREIDCFDV